jgi:hypothetical protein
MNKKLPVPPGDCKKIFIQDIPDDKVYGRGAYDESLKNVNRIQEWSFVQSAKRK